tara:strand:- start:1004 stop:1285 length:282 start_codon:yes stop_codon:yes gene_type:complete
MAITKTTEEDKIEVVSKYKKIQLRTATVVEEDGVELARSFHRKQIYPGSIDASNNYTQTNISSESTEVKNICNAVWTTAVHDAWKAKLIADKG